MTPRYIAVDGMLSGTGIRNTVAGGYIEPTQLGLSSDLIAHIKRWLKQYEEAHYTGFGDHTEVEKLDQEGIKISQKLQSELPQSKVEYYSHAQSSKLSVPHVPTPHVHDPATPGGIRPAQPHELPK